MLLEDVLSLCRQSEEVVLFDCESHSVLAEYDGKDSIPVEFNKCKVRKIEYMDTGYNRLHIHVEAFSELAVKLDRIMKTYEPYDYRDMEFSVEQAEYTIKNNPLSVIESLIGILDNYIDEED